MFVHRAPAVNPSGDTASSRSAHEHRSWGAWLIGLGWRRIARELLLVAAIVVMSTLVLRRQAINQPFSVDESRWIATSRYFWYTFVDRAPVRSAVAAELPRVHPPARRPLRHRLRALAPGLESRSAQRALRQHRDPPLERARGQRPRQRPAPGGPPGHAGVRGDIGGAALRHRAPARRAGGLGSRVARVGERTFSTLATPAGPLPFSPDVVLVSVGLGVL